MSEAPEPAPADPSDADQNTTNQITADQNAADQDAADRNTTDPARGPARRWTLAPIILAVFVLGWAAGALLQPVDSGGGSAESPAEKAVWTCSMHPQVKLPKMGKCPVCFMDLIKLEKTGDSDVAELAMSEAGARLAEIETAPARRAVAEAQLGFVGEVAYDETRIKTISAWIPGRLDRLYVDYTGIAVRKGDHLVTLFSPDLISAQEELLQAIKAVEDLSQSESRLMLSTARETVKAAREKLRLLGLTDRQVKAIEERGAVDDQVTIFAPAGGIVVHKNATEGMYVQTGSPIYKIADLSFVWVYLEAYESDLAWLRYGQSVRFETEAYPGELFEGRISFIDPVLDTRTRTVKVRVNAPNADGRLKPGMFVRARVTARMVSDGKVLERSLEDKWISPMHPEIIKDQPGTCDVCGMDLVRAEALGLAGPDGPFTPPLLIPRSAVLYTGRRSVVYVKKLGADKPTYQGRVVTLGPQAGDEVIVRSGLDEGDEVVVKGAFKIDSALQIEARPSMMSRGPEDLKRGASAPEKSHAKPLAPIDGPRRAALRSELSSAVAPYLDMQAALARDDAAAARKALKGLASRLGELAHLADAPDRWLAILAEAGSHARGVAAEAELTALRESFSSVSGDLIPALEAVGAPRALIKVRCPMAFGNRGATWIQAPGTIANPYFGAAMLRCGDVTREYRAEDG